MSKRMVEVTTDCLKYVFDGANLSSALSSIQRLIEEYGPDATIDINTESEPYSSYERAYLHIQYKREETDEEESLRMAREAAQKSETEARERATFERLKAKFGE